MRILITGAGGLLGGRLSTLLSADHATTGLVRKQPAPEGVATVSADLIDERAVTATLRDLRPEAVIHCAALADPEACERDPKWARRDNEMATRTLAAACRREGARLISISTDLVFGGTHAFSTENSPAEPVSEYGRSKLRAETATLEECPDSVILRIALVCGRGYGPRLSASEGIAQRLRGGQTVTLFEDEWRTPIDPESVAQAIHAVLLRPHLRGLFHIGGSERLSRFELGERVAAACGLNQALLRRSLRSSHEGAPRPQDVSLQVARAREELAWAPRPLAKALGEGRDV